MGYKTLVTKLNRKEQNMNIQKHIQKQVTIKKTPKQVALLIWDGQVLEEGSVNDTYTRLEVNEILKRFNKLVTSGWVLGYGEIAMSSTGIPEFFQAVLDEVEGLRQWGDEPGYTEAPSVDYYLKK